MRKLSIYETRNQPNSTEHSLNYIIKLYWEKIILRLYSFQTVFFSTLIALFLGLIPSITQTIAYGDQSLSILNMGDSYTAGPGLDPILDDTCYRSGNNYAHQLAVKLHAQLTDISCTGATSMDFTTSQRNDSGKLENPAQFTALNRPYDVIFVTIGGNDAGIIDMVTQCTDSSQPVQTCQQAITQTQQNLRSAYPKILAVYRYIREHEPHTLLIGMGYGQPIPKHSCPAAPISPAVLYQFSQVMNKLNALVKASVLSEGGKYIDNSLDTLNHNICSPHPWYVGIIPPPPGQGIIVHPRVEWMNHMTFKLLPLINAWVHK